MGLICYEAVYPDVVRHAVRQGARLLLNLTNDAWYGHSSAPHQFLAITALRSAETGLPMLRAANTGVSAVIDARGVVLQETPIFEQAALTVEVPRARATPTFYTRVGNWPLALSWLVLAGSALERDSTATRQGVSSAGAVVAPVQAPVPARDARVREVLRERVLDATRVHVARFGT